MYMYVSATKRSEAIDENRFALHKRYSSSYITVGWPACEFDGSLLMMPLWLV